MNYSISVPSSLFVFRILILRAMDQYSNEECVGSESPTGGMNSFIALSAAINAALRNYTSHKMKKT